MKRISPTWFAESESMKVSAKLNQNDFFLPVDVEVSESDAFLFTQPLEVYSLLFVPIGSKKAVMDLDWTFTFPLSNHFEHNGFWVLFSIPHEIERVVRKMEKASMRVIPVLPAYTEPYSDEEGEDAPRVVRSDGHRFKGVLVHAKTQRKCPW
ncbi:MAG: hypothetical protein WA056_02205 [Gallionella sp.]